MASAAVNDALRRAASRIQELESANRELRLEAARRKELQPDRAPPPAKRRKVRDGAATAALAAIDPAAAALAAAAAETRAVAAVVARFRSADAVPDAKERAALIASVLGAAGSARERTRSIRAHLAGLVQALRAAAVAGSTPRALAAAAALEQLGTQSGEVAIVRAARCDLVLWQLLQFESSLTTAAASDGLPPLTCGLECVEQLVAVEWPGHALPRGEDGGVSCTADAVVRALRGGATAAAMSACEAELDRGLETTLASMERAVDAEEESVALICRALQLQVAARGWTWGHDVLLLQRLWPLNARRSALKPAVLRVAGAVGRVAMLLGERAGLPALRSVLMQILAAPASASANGSRVTTHAEQVAAARAALQVWSGRSSSMLLRAVVAWRRGLDEVKRRELPDALRRAYAVLAEGEARH